MTLTDFAKSLEGKKDSAPVPPGLLDHHTGKYEYIGFPSIRIDTTTDGKLLGTAEIRLHDGNGNWLDKGTSVSSANIVADCEEDAEAIAAVQRAMVDIQTICAHLAWRYAIDVTEQADTASVNTLQSEKDIKIASMRAQLDAMTADAEAQRNVAEAKIKALTTEAQAQQDAAVAQVKAITDELAARTADLAAMTAQRDTLAHTYDAQVKADRRKKALEEAVAAKAAADAKIAELSVETT